MAEIKSLHGNATPDLQPCADTIRLLRALLERAEAGQIKGICFATVSNIGSVASGWGGSADRINMAASVAALHQRMMMYFVEQGT